MNILLTGGSGYIGSHAAVVLIEAGHHVVLLDNFCNSSPEIVSRVTKITGTPPKLVQLDVRDTTKLIQVIESYSIDAVFHFAGLKAVGESVKHPLDYYANNVLGSLSLVQAMDFCGLRTLVFSSSATVYGEPKYLPIDESHPTCATSPYGRSKLHVEEILRDVATADTTWRIACLRYFNPVGAHPSGLIGEQPSNTPNNLVPYIAQVAAKLRLGLKVFGSDYATNDGTGVRDYVHVMDLAEGHLAALNFLDRTTGWHAINLGTGHGHSVLEMIRAFELASGHSIPYELAPRRSGDVAASYASATKAERLLNWRAKLALTSMCESAWAHQQQH
jgi:UDP-glucose 4-epimerase